MSLARKRLGSTGLTVSRLALGNEVDADAGMPLATLDPALVAQLDELTAEWRKGDAPR